MIYIYIYIINVYIYNQIDIGRINDIDHIGIIYIYLHEAQHMAMFIDIKYTL